MEEEDFDFVERSLQTEIEIEAELAGAAHMVDAEAEDEGGDTGDEEEIRSETVSDKEFRADDQEDGVGEEGSDDDLANVGVRPRPPQFASDDENEMSTQNSGRSEMPGTNAATPTQQSGRSEMPGTNAATEKRDEEYSVGSRECSEDENDDENLNEDAHAKIYYHPANCNNMSRSLKIVDGERKKNLLRLEHYHGNLHVFVSEAVDGPVLSEMALKTICAFLHITKNHVHRVHCCKTDQLHPTFRSGSKSGDNAGPLDTLKLVDGIGTNPYGINSVLEYKRAIGQQVNEIPFDMVCDFREEVLILARACAAGRPKTECGCCGNAQKAETKQIELHVDVAEIILAPVRAWYTESGERKQKTFWIVAIKTKVCYDLSGHIASLLVDIDTNDASLRKRIASGGVEKVEVWLCKRCRDLLP